MDIRTQSQTAQPQVEKSVLSTGEIQTIGSGFEARRFRHTAFSGLMDPLIMVDHFTMTEPTFDTHAHAGLSAVSLLFEDSTGFFNNRDSLGHDINLAPGDLYWLKAGRGAVHNEANRPGARIHALQIFVNLPARMKHDAPASLHVPAGEVPVIQGPGHRARLVLGQSHGLAAGQSPALPMTILDLFLAPGGTFEHRAGPDQGIWVYAVDGAVEVRVPGHDIALPQGSSVALRGVARMELHGAAAAHAVILHGTPVREHFVQRGPFAMSTLEDLEAVAAAHAAGRLGRID
ncbi:MAG TPA: pirin family protein [Thermohalobaculum sp.]|nr:pirin family protein [Thermohalobaculum sp.]